MGIRGSRARWALWLAIGLVVACDRTPDWPATTSWTSYTHPSVGYRLDVPSGCNAQEQGDDVVFRWNGQPILCVHYVTRERGRRRGLWPGNDPVGRITLAGHAGKRYVYQHYDGPSCMNVVAYVIPYGGRELGLEFRTHASELGPLQRHVVDSFALPD